MNGCSRRYIAVVFSIVGEANIMKFINSFDEIHPECVVGLIMKNI
jgi:hypothetical protein